MAPAKVAKQPANKVENRARQILTGEYHCITASTSLPPLVLHFTTTPTLILRKRPTRVPTTTSASRFRSLQRRRLARTRLSSSIAPHRLSSTLDSSTSTFVVLPTLVCAHSTLKVPRPSPTPPPDQRATKGIPSYTQRYRSHSHRRPLFFPTPGAWVASSFAFLPCPPFFLLHSRSFFAPLQATRKNDNPSSAFSGS